MSRVTYGGGAVNPVTAKVVAKQMDRQRHPITGVLLPMSATQRGMEITQMKKGIEFAHLSFSAEWEGLNAHIWTERRSF